MTQVIDFFFSVVIKIWALIVQNWVLSFAILIAIIGKVVSLINESYKQ